VKYVLNIERLFFPSSVFHKFSKPFLGTQTKHLMVNVGDVDELSNHSNRKRQYATQTIKMLIAAQMAAIVAARPNSALVKVVWISKKHPTMFIRLFDGGRLRTDLKMRVRVFGDVEVDENCTIKLSHTHIIRKIEYICTYVHFKDLKFSEWI
jgi:hypothetical protein